MSDGFTVLESRRNRWFSVQNIVIDRYGQHIGPSGVAVYTALCRRANNESNAAWPSHRRLCQDTGIKSRTTLKKVIHELSTWGLVAIEARFDEGGQRSNQYTLLEPPGTPTQNMTPPQILEGGLSDAVPGPGTKEKPGPGTADGYIKKTSIEKDSVEDGEDKISVRQITDTVTRVVRDVDMGWPIEVQLETGRLDAELWSRVKQTNLARAMMKQGRTW